MISKSESDFRKWNGTMEWLRPSIEAKVRDIFDFFVENEDGEEVAEQIEKIPHDCLLELENFYLLTVRKAIHKAYTIGIDDAFRLLK